MASLFLPSLRTSVGFVVHTLYQTKTYLRKLNHTPTLEPSPPTAPSHLDVEVTNLCNANCVFCGYQYQKRPIQYMSNTLFEKIVVQYNDLGGGPLGLTPIVGEALIDKQIVEKIALARKQPNITDIRLTTNAILLTRDCFESLVREGLTHLTVSLPGFSRKEYREVYRNDAYPRLIKNLSNVASSSLFERCEVELSLRTKRLFPWLDRDYWKLKKLGYRMNRTWLYDNWSGQIRQEDLPLGMWIRPNPRKAEPCSMLYSGPTVLSSGKITACGCRDLDGTSELALGSLEDVPLKEAWSFETLEPLRQRFRDGDLPDLCRDCRHYNPASDHDA